MIVHQSAYDIEGQIGDRPSAKKPPLGGRNTNAFLSGVYIILGISIEFGPEGIKTILKLGKRKWSINPGIASEPEPITSDNG